MTRPRTLEQHLVRAVKHPDGCWLWTGALDRYGYPERVVFEGRRVRPYVLFYESVVGPIPKGLQPDHLCRNTVCVNPGHIEPVTPRENVLRSEGVAAINARRTQCVNGHEFNETNTWRSKKSGRRACRVCVRDRKRAERAV